MKQRKNRRLPLFWRLMLSITAAWVLLLSVNLGVTLHYALDAQKKKIDNVLMSTVVTLGDSHAVRRVLEQGYCGGELAAYLTDVVCNTEDLEYITIADKNSIRLFFIDPDGIGKSFEGGDQYRALAGESYLSDAQTVHFKGQRRAFHPVKDESGEVLGFVMASATHDRIIGLRGKIYSSYFSLGVLLLACTLAASGLLAVYMGRYLRGIRPEDLLRAYLTQSDILDALDEGIVSFDKAGRVRLVNGAAARMLGHREDLLLGKNVDELLRASDGSSLRDCQGSGLGLDTSRPNILARPVKLPGSNRWARQVLILLDRSEVTRYAEELGGTRHMISTLRANTHEFLNKLQVISGLLQMGRTEEAQAYIGTISAVHEHITGPVMRLIRNTSVAALLLGKASNMRELEITPILLSNSELPENSRYLSTTELVTVVGNLLENAIEATSVIPLGDLRSVALQITENEKGLLIMVSDTGEGISQEELAHIFDRGFSTKAASGRGVGMNRIREILDSHGGTIDVDTEPGSGTTFTLIFNRERGGTQ